MLETVVASSFVGGVVSDAAGAFFDSSAGASPGAGVSAGVVSNAGVGVTALAGRDVRPDEIGRAHV